ncbi:MAG TPA: DUF4118 domain-containing protein [Bryobacteraceae bacterium]|nr:DUF4118 domain-containing protein [Bryobacteraceae bacterium]
MKPSHKPYLFVATYFLCVTCIAIFAFATIPPRFMDVYLIGIAFIAARWSWRPAILLYFLSLLMLAWVLPPMNSFVVSEGHDQLRLALYGATALAIILAIELARATRPK